MVKPNYSTKSIMYPQMMCNLIRKRKKKKHSNTMLIGSCLKFIYYVSTSDNDSVSGSNQSSLI